MSLLMWLPQGMPRELDPKRGLNSTDTPDPTITTLATLPATAWGPTVRLRSQAAGPEGAVVPGHHGSRGRLVASARVAPCETDNCGVTAGG